MSRSEETKAPVQQPSEDWALLPWHKLEQHVYRLQKRIYQASSRGNVQAVHRLQQLLIRSRSAQLLAVRRVTQDNQGKQTAGVDGKTALTPKERLDLVSQLHPKHTKRQKPLPVRRVWISKPGKTEKRPLGIPTIRDRASQALAKLVLEPEWEAKFEANSYGFRPGRGCHDAIEAVFNEIRYKAKYVLDADIKGCFDHLAHQALMEKLATYPTMRRAITAWLKAGIMEGVEFSPTEEGAPQGGVLSPLLANVALHGLETRVRQAFTEKEGKPALIRYADDFVALHPTREGVEKARQVVELWLKDIGLELKPSKTRTVHTLEGNAGFDFLGFHIRHYRVGKLHTANNTFGKPLGFKTIITPSKEAIKRHLFAVGKLIREEQAAPQEALITRLNPVIRGWANYYRTVCSKETYSQCDHLVYEMLRRWAQRRHHGKGKRWVARKYWALEQGQGWTFAASETMRLQSYATIPIKRHVKVQGRKSPYDGTLVYWVQRLKDHPLTKTRTAFLLRLQQGRCAFCGLTFKHEDLLEIDHIIPRRLGGDDRLMNLQLLHRHCHDRKTAHDGSHQAGKDQGIQ